MKLKLKEFIKNNDLIKLIRFSIGRSWEYIS